MTTSSVTVDGATVPYLLCLHDSDPVKSRNWLLELHVPRTEAGLALSRRFRDACYGMPRTVRWFHQGGCLPGDEISTWQMFEFWTRDQDMILDAVSEVVASLGLDLRMEPAESGDLRSLMA